MKLIGKLVCFFKGHKRGVRVFTPDGGDDEKYGALEREIIGECL